MTLVTHISTQVQFEVLKEGPKTVILKVTANPRNCPGICIGMIQKTTPKAIELQFTKP